MLKDKRIAVLGAGHMGGALIGGLLRGKPVSGPKNITATRRDAERLAEVRRKWDVHTTSDNRKAVKGADVVIVAVKPQGAGATLEEIAPVVDKKQLFISVMAGIQTSFINARLKKPCPVVRAMPNTPAFVDEGATAIAAGAHAGEADLKTAEAIFKAVGRVEVLPEN